mgnify:CR=1 FL=1
MTVHFAAARSAISSPVARALSRRTPGRSANDNGNGGSIEANDNVIHAALRHFAAHGLGAARQARAQAEAAFFAGDRQGYDWWLGICRALDKRIAGQLEAAASSAHDVQTPAEQTTLRSAETA